MYLEKLEIQGFKSFATKNILVFPGMLDKEKRGLTAVVGPNGSGKSNVADSVRWALGEQSMKTLRGKKSEDVIFSGSDKKGKLGMAEVSLFLNNEDYKAPIDFSQIVLTRRLYRDGESEYLLNNNRVRLSDIQMLLAKASFGQKTYSVIGQGTVEGFLNTSLSERKEFFDEATGVKQYQIKRDESLNKLRSSYDNLTQAHMLVVEIEPRLKSLTRQVGRLKRRGEIETELKDLQSKYFSKIWHDINNKFKEYNSRFLELEKNKLAKDKKMSNLNRELEEFKLASQENNDYERLQKELAKKQADRQDINRKLAKIEAQLEMKLESQGKFDLSFLLSKKEELNREKSAIEEEQANITGSIESNKKNADTLVEERDKVNNNIKSLKEELNKLNLNANDSGWKKLNDHLRNVLNKLRLLGEEEDLEKIKSAINEIKEEIKEVLATTEESTEDELKQTANEKWQVLQESLDELSRNKESLVEKINEYNLRTSSLEERRKLLAEKLTNINNDFFSIESKLKQNSEEIDLGDMKKDEEGLKKRLEDINSEINAVQEEISKINSAEESKRNRLFALQKEMQELQNEINDLSNQLNEIKISSTRYETKLEDLESEIRQELGSLKEVMENKYEDEFDIEDTREKIKQLKHQIELIGGIDPQIEKEYDETKERYDFLTGQIDDFSKTVDSLQEIIKELDVNIKDRFDKEFKLIADKFEEYFKILFNGGNAKIIKVMEEEMDEEKEETTAEGEAQAAKTESQSSVVLPDIKKIKYLQKHNATGLAGIEIQATPPGKKIQSISMLSGGERALTAIALICAIISSNPSPFVVLDEVDAALDEANSERLAKILDELSHKTQFIVITHNRASMRKANILYGVTMGDDGVSKLLSVKLDEVKID